MADDVTPNSQGATSNGHHLRRRPWTVTAVAVLLVIEAIVFVEHARRLLADIVTAEETLGIAALGPLDREVPAAVLEGFAALGLLVAAFSIVRRSQLALVYVLVVQAVVVVDVVLRLTGGLAVGPTVGMFGLALCIAATAAAPATRRWCDEPIRQ